MSSTYMYLFLHISEKVENTQLPVFLKNISDISSLAIGNGFQKDITIDFSKYNLEFCPNTFKEKLG